MLIIHLSDIHFRKSEIQTTQDPNFHLRNELLRDIEQFKQLLGPANVIIISGDIAFSGHPEEYAFATEWLSELCEHCGTDMSAIFVCPGNHDVVRATADRSVIRMIHNSIKEAKEIALDATIRGLLTEPETARLLYEGLDNYNVFAQQFFCDLLPPDRTRAVRDDLRLNDDSMLKLWGLNTCFVSSSADKEGDLFIDPASLQITREQGVTNVVVAHHPLSWLRQKQQLEDHLNDVAPIQIFGHVHTNRIHMNRDWIRVTAGATHPDRQEPGWEPGYNLIDLHVEHDNGTRWLHVNTHVRVWQTAPGGFQPKKDRRRDVFEHRILLEPWESSHARTVPASSTGSASTDAHLVVPEVAPMTRLREIGIRFYRLSFSKKSEIAGRLNLLEAEDMTQPDFERFRRVLFRAHERGKVGELENAISEAEEVGGS